MLVILDPKDSDQWLTPALKNLEWQQPPLRADAAAKMTAYPVGPAGKQPSNRYP